MDKVKRCAWANGSKMYQKYHDEEWGVPLHDDKKHFEMLILEGAQAGLSWSTILRRREGYRKAFKNFDVKKVAKMTDDELEEQLQNPEIIRNRLKIYATRKNAVAFLQIQKEFGKWISQKIKLIENIEQGINNLLKNFNKLNDFAIDQYWSDLQKIDKWYLLTPLTVTQRPDYSDIERRHTNYNRVMLDLDKKALRHLKVIKERVILSTAMNDIINNNH